MICVVIFFSIVSYPLFPPKCCITAYNVCTNISDKEFKGQMVQVEMAARKVPAGGFVRGRGKSGNKTILEAKVIVC